MTDLTKLNPARTLEDQDAEPARIVLGPPAHSSPRGHTEMRKSLAEVDLDTGTFPPTHAAAAQAASEARSDAADEDKKAGDWKAEVEAAQTQEELDAVSERYADSGNEFRTVEAAIDKRQTELDAPQS